MTHILTEAGISASRLRQSLAHYAAATHYSVVCDPQTYAAWGAQIEAALQDGDVVHQCIMLAAPKASIQQAHTLAAQLPDDSCVLAIGSGTLNDICKYASFLRQLPYVVAATAPSMNGYVSANASLMHEGQKSSFKAHAPLLLLADTEILAAAPLRLIQAGLGDTLCRSTVQSDWLLSHYVRETEYRPELLAPLFPLERALMQGAGTIPLRSTEMVALLFEALIVSGQAMQAFGGSEPASQGEHMLAHVMDGLLTEAQPSSEPAYHGEAIAVTSLTMAYLQEQYLQQSMPPSLRYDAASSAAGKQIDAMAMQERLVQHWAEIRRAIDAVSVPAQQLQEALELAGCPITPRAIGWEEETYRKALMTAYSTRERFTFLDLKAS